MNEAIARLEAKLRGLHFHICGPIGQFYHGREIAMPDAVGDAFYSEPVGTHDICMSMSTDPATAEGREWWEESLVIESLWHSGTQEWSAELNWPGMGHRFAGTCYFAKTRIEAVTTAIEETAKAAGEEVK